MALKTQIVCLLLLMGLTTASRAAIPIYAPKETPTLIFQKQLPDGRSLNVFQKRLPANPATLAQKWEGLPPGARVVPTDYSVSYTFSVAKGGKNQETLWVRRLDHFEGNDNPLIDGSILKVRDATVEGRVLVAVLKQSASTFAVIVQPKPDGMGTETARVKPHPETRLAMDAPGMYSRYARIDGSLLKGTLSVDVTFIGDKDVTLLGNKHKRFLWKGGKWSKQEDNPTTVSGYVRAHQPNPAGPKHFITIMTSGGRALRDALHLLEGQLGCTITYEDPQRESADAAEPLFPGGGLVPRTHSLSFTYQPQIRSRFDVIQSLVARYNQGDRTAVFAVSSTADTNVFDVKPVKVKDKTGKLTIRRPLLDTTLSVTSPFTISDVMKALNAASAGDGNKRERNNPRLGLVPTRRLDLSALQASVTGKRPTARQCLDALIPAYVADAEASERKAPVKGDQPWRVSWVVNTNPNGRHDRNPGSGASVLYFEYFHAVAAPATDETNICVEDARPLAVAAAMIGARLASSVIYEDAPWASSSEVLQDRNGVAQALRGGILTYAFASHAQPAQVVQGCVNAYNAQDNPGQFASKPVGQAFYIYPVQSMTANGSPNTITKPVLGNEVSFSATRVPLSEVLQRLCLSLSVQSGKTVLLGSLTRAAVPSSPLSYTAHAKAASACLAELTKQLNVNMSWQLLYEPQTQQYTLNANSPSRPSEQNSIDGASGEKTNAPSMKALSTKAQSGSKPISTALTVTALVQCTTDDFDAWVKEQRLTQEGGGIANPQKPTIMEDALIARLRAGKPTSDKSVLLVVAAFMAYDEGVIYKRENRMPSVLSYPETEKLVPLLRSLVGKRPLLVARLYDLEAEMAENADDNLKAASVLQNEIDLLKSTRLDKNSQTATDLLLFPALVRRAEALYAVGRVKEAEPLYLEVMDYLYWKVKEPVANAALGYTYVSAAQGLINCRQNDLRALRQISLDGGWAGGLVRPLLEERISIATSLNRLLTQPLKP